MNNDVFRYDRPERRSSTSDRRGHQSRPHRELLEPAISSGARLRSRNVTLLRGLSFVDWGGHPNGLAPCRPWTPAQQPKGEGRGASRDSNATRSAGDWEARRHGTNEAVRVLRAVLAHQVGQPVEQARRNVQRPRKRPFGQARSRLPSIPRPHASARGHTGTCWYSLSR